MKLFLWPSFGKEDGQGGIKRVWEMLNRWLPEYGVEFVDDIYQADVVNIHADFMDVRGIPIAYSNHGLYWAGYQWPHWAMKANERIVRGMKRAHAISTPSEWVANSLRRGMLADPYVLLHGVELEDWEPADNRGYVLWAKTRPDPVCDPRPVELLAQQARNRQFVTTIGPENLPNVKVTGKLPHHEIAELIRHADVYLATVEETCGITTIEAMACGVPCLGYAYGGNLELIVHEETGYLVKPGDILALAEGLDYIRAHRERLGENARQHVKDHFQARDRAAAYIPFYEAAIREFDRQQESPRVSVVITAYNLEEYLPAAIESVINQRGFDDWELIIVDDASPDSCGRIADAYAASDPRIRVIHNRKNRYLAGARNVGFEASTGAYLIPLDADDELHHNTLVTLVDYLDHNPDASVVTGGFQVIRPDGSRFVSGWPPDEPSYHEQIVHHNQVPYASMYRRWVWEKTGGYRERMRTAEDAEFWCRAFSFGAEPYKVTSVPTLIYNDRPSSMSHVEPEGDWTSWFTWSRMPNLTPFAVNPHNVMKYGPPKLTVVIPVGPGHDFYLKDALDSLVSQTFQRWEVIVVNDTGEKWFHYDENNEREIVNPFIRGFPFARFIDSEGPPRGPAWARNRGLEETKTEAFVLLDADDYLQPMALDILYKIWTEYGGWCYGDWYDQDGRYKPAGDFDFEETLNKMQGPSTGIYNLHHWRRVGGFDENCPGWEDWDFQLSLMGAGICGSRVAHPIFTYRYDTGRRREDNFKGSEENLAYLRRKHRKLLERGTFTMGCKRCPGGGGSRRVSVAKSAAAANDQAMAVVKYTGVAVQKRRVKSSTVPGKEYVFSGNQREMFVFPSDVAWFESHLDFEVVQAPGVALTGVEEELPTLQAEETRERPRIKFYMIEELEGILDEFIIRMVKNAGYRTIDELRIAVETRKPLLAIKGLGETRVDAIAEAIAEFDRQNS